MLFESIGLYLVQLNLLGVDLSLLKENWAILIARYLHANQILVNSDYITCKSLIKLINLKGVYLISLINSDIKTNTTKN